jgi:hypothetical protein
MSKERKKVSRIVLDDADTGDEILYFVRLFYRRRDAIRLKVPRPYLYLRDRDTKRFIKRLKEMEVRMFMVVDYSYEEAKKGNPLYVDAVGKSLLSAKDLYDKEGRIEEIEGDLEEGVRWHVIENFGDAVEHQLLDLAGVEYGSMPSVEQKYEDGKFYGVLVWKHHERDEPRSKKEERTL